MPRPQSTAIIAGFFGLLLAQAHRMTHNSLRSTLCLALLAFGCSDIDGVESMHLALGPGDSFGGGGAPQVFGDRPNNGPFLLAHAGVEDSPTFPAAHPYLPRDATLDGTVGTLGVRVGANHVAALTFTSADASVITSDLVNTTFTDSLGAALAINDTRTFTSLSGPNATPFQYEVYDITRNGAPLCSGENVAVAVPGTFDHTATLLTGTGDITFACALGAAAKCINLGFAPNIPSQNGSFGDTDSFLACERMLRFELDHGTSATLFNTQIDLIDDSGVLTLSEPWPVEAAWTSDGPLCLSRHRWNTMPIDYSDLPDPRLGISGEFCEDMIPQNLDVFPPALSALGIRMISHSNIQADALLSWQRLGSSGTSAADYITTTAGQYSNDGAMIAPAGADQDIVPLYEGALLSSPTGYGAPLVPLFKYAGTKLITTNSTLGGAKVRLGFVCPAPPLFHSLTLDLFRTTTQYYGTTRYPGRMGVPSTVVGDTQGYLLGWPE